VFILHFHIRKGSNGISQLARLPWNPSLASFIEGIVQKYI
jgi:hypothetical protein